MQGFHAPTSLSVLRAANPDPEEERLPGDARTADVPPTSGDEDERLDG